jgi:hypothetical protein
MKDTSHRECQINWMATDFPYTVEMLTEILSDNDPDEIKDALRKVIEVFKRLSMED